MEQPFRIASFLLLVAAAAVVLPSGARAQAAGEGEPPVAERCRPDRFHEFDFWIGDWDVRNGEGRLIGHNSIRRVSEGCALLEDWRSAGGNRGMSLNTYDPDRDAWTQRWVGAGSTLWVTGGLEDGSMVLEGAAPRGTPRGPVLDRITWTPLPDGRVRQLWELSTDGGTSWSQAFVGFYERTARD